MHFFLHLCVFGLVVLTPALAQAQGVLENPAEGPANDLQGALPDPWRAFSALIEGQKSALFYLPILFWPGRSTHQALERLRRGLMEKEDDNV